MDGAMHNYTVTFLGPRSGRRSVGVRDATCASEAESMARAAHPEHADDIVYDICRTGLGTTEMPVNGVRPHSRKKLEE